MSSSSVRVVAFTCGWLTGDLGGFLEGATGSIKVPVGSYLITHPRGTVVFDSGLAADLAVDPHNAGKMADLFEIHFERDHAVDARLAAHADTAASEVDVLVNSHLHFDHCGGNSLVPNARVIIQDAEWRAAQNEKLIASDTYSPKLFDLGQDVLRVDGEHDVFGDGRVVCIPTPGHTAGHQSLRVRTDDEEIVLCGDACYFRRTLETMTLPSFGWRRETQLESLQRLARLERAGARLVFGHDPDQWATLAERVDR